jgi:hypothetical protein
VVEKSAVFLANNGTDGVLQYTSVAGDFAPHGTYQIQSDVVMAGLYGPGTVALFDVYKNL